MSRPDGLCIYATNHPNSQVVCRAIEQGSGGRIVPPVRLMEGPAAIYGILRGCDQIIKQCEWVRRDYYHIDHGYLRRGWNSYSGYYRITRNGLQWSANGREYPDDRFKRFGISLKPWRKSGRHVLVCPISTAIGAFYGIDPQVWLQAIVEEIGAHTDRPVTIKPKDSDLDLKTALNDAWCLVTFNSNAAIEALIEGVPVFVTGPAAARAMGSPDLSKIDEPRYGNREAIFAALAYQQWTLDEIRRGECWEWM